MKNNNKGQSTLEFILSFTAVVGFIFLFFKMSVNYANGYMVQHAVFMASRAYLVHDAQVDGFSWSDDLSRDEKAFKYAEATVFKRYLPDNLITPYDGVLTVNKIEDKAKFTPFLGLWVQFSQKFSLGFIGGNEKLKFRSESFLGREPTRFEGYQQTCAAIGEVAAGKCDKLATLDDNGG